MLIVIAFQNVTRELLQLRFFGEINTYFASHPNSLPLFCNKGSSEWTREKDHLIELKIKLVDRSERKSLASTVTKFEVKWFFFSNV